MIDFEYTLSPYAGKSSRYTCPSCKKPGVFSLYIEKKSGKPVAASVGRCNREINCGYHYKPQDFFRDHPGEAVKNFVQNNQYSSPQPVNKTNTPSYIDNDIVYNSLGLGAKNHLLLYLDGLFGHALSQQLAIKYQIGTSMHWPGATVFWQRDRFHNIRTGKIMLYNPQTGKRVKTPYNHISWVHSLKPEKDFQLQQCLFGEHLLNDAPAKPVAIVESEKTAIIASVYMPDFIWLATGGISNFTPIKCAVLNGRNIGVFPDLKCYAVWKVKAKKITATIDCKIVVSDLLESKANNQEKKEGLDIADYLIKRDTDYGWALSDFNYPLFWDHQNII